MDVYFEPAPWPERVWDPHLPVAAGLLLFTGYLAAVLVLAIVAPVDPVALTRNDDRRLPVRIETRAAREPEAPITKTPNTERPATEAVAEAPTGQALTAPPAAIPAPGPEIPEIDELVAETANADVRAPIDLTLPEPEPMRTMPPVCRAGPCAPGTATLPRIRPRHRPADEVIADLDPEVLERLDLEALGIDPDLGDIYGERRVGVNRYCDLVRPEDNVVTRQMGMPVFLRCRRSTESKARAQALLDALREKRPDLFDER